MNRRIWSQMLCENIHNIVGSNAKGKRNKSFFWFPSCNFCKEKKMKNEFNHRLTNFSEYGGTISYIQEEKIQFVNTY